MQNCSCRNATYAACLAEEHSNCRNCRNRLGRSYFRCICEVCNHQPFAHMIQSCFDACLSHHLIRSSSTNPSQKLRTGRLVAVRAAGDDYDCCDYDRMMSSIDQMN